MHIVRLSWLTHSPIIGKACCTCIIKLKAHYKSTKRSLSMNESTTADILGTGDFPERSGSQDTVSSQMQVSPPGSGPVPPSASDSLEVW